MTCCDNHDGPHLHGCAVTRRDDGREHGGACLLRLTSQSLEQPSFGVGVSWA